MFSAFFVAGCAAISACRGDEPKLSGDTLALPPDGDADAGLEQIVASTPLDGGTTDVPCPTPSTTELDDVIDVSAADDFACALRRNGAVVCWGRNDARYRVMGAARAAVVAKPVAIEGLTNVREIGTGTGHACARDASGVLSCWGSNLVGEAGTGAVGGVVYPPVAVENLTNVTHVGVGADHVCATTATGVWCWGSRTKGRTGQPAGNASASGVASLVAGLPTGEPVFVAAGEASCTIVKTGDTSATYCWGNNYDGQLGIGSTSDADFATPQLVSALGARALEISLSPLRFGCARAKGVALTCWGHNESGAIGDVLPGSPVRSPVEAYPSVLTAEVTRVASYGRNTCAVTKEGYVACMGANDAGQLGTGVSDAVDHGAPQFVRESRSNANKLSRAFDVAVGGSAGRTGFACAAVGERAECGGRVMCWGTNQYGQLGNAAQVDGTNPDLTEPFAVRVANP